MLGKERALLPVWEELHLLPALEELHLQKLLPGLAWLLKGSHLLTVVVVHGLAVQAQEHRPQWGAPSTAQQVLELEPQLEVPESEEAQKQLA